MRALCLDRPDFGSFLSAAGRRSPCSRAWIEEEGAMPSILALLMMTLWSDGAQASTGHVTVESELAVTIQIHDYADVRSESLSRASDIVTRLYGKIGVRTEWIGVLRHGKRRAHSPVDRESHNRIGQLTIIILTPQMAARGRVADGVLGYAAVPEQGMGRIAYVIYDRVRQAAAGAATNEDELLGCVMAHEIGHLLLPRGTQSMAGLMKGHLDHRDLRQLDVRKLTFSTLEASQIRSMLERNPTTVLANATGAGSSAADTDVTATFDDSAPQAAHDR